MACSRCVKSCRLNVAGASRRSGRKVDSATRGRQATETQQRPKGEGRGGGGKFNGEPAQHAQHVQHAQQAQPLWDGLLRTMPFNYLSNNPQSHHLSPSHSHAASRLVFHGGCAIHHITHHLIVFRLSFCHHSAHRSPCTERFHSQLLREEGRGRQEPSSCSSSATGLPSERCDV